MVQEPNQNSRIRPQAPGFATLAALLILACSGGRQDRSNVSGDVQLEILTSFSLALSKREFEKAIGHLAESERTQLLGPDGKVSPEVQDRLRALQLSTLYKDPSVRVSHRKISGIAGSLPVLKQAEAVDSLLLPDEADAPSPAVVSELAVAPGPDLDPIRKTTRDFFRSIRSRQWRKALNYLDDRERAVFMQRNGDLRTGTRRRLSAADTSAWDALSLKDGKLMGVVLIVPPLSQVLGGRRVY